MKRKIVCSTCGEIIEVSDDDEMVYCPKCSKPLNINQGERYYSLVLARYYNLGMEQLYNQTAYEEAIVSFKKVLELNKDELNAVQGLALATLLISTVRDSHLEESLNVLKKNKSVLKVNNFNIDSVASFLESVVKYLDQFELTLENRLMEDGLFYDEKCLTLYKKAIKDILNYKTFLKNVYYKDRRYSSNSDISYESLNEQIENLSTLLDKKLKTMKTPSKNLDSGDSHSLIEDRVFADNRSLYKRKRHIKVWLIIFFILFLIGIVLILTLRHYLLIGVPLAGLSLLVFIILLISNSKIKRKLSI